MYGVQEAVLGVATWAAEVRIVPAPRRLEKNLDTEEKKLQQRTAQPEAKPAAAERTAQPKAKPKAKPVHLMPEPWGPKGYSKGKQYRTQGW